MDFLGRYIPKLCLVCGVLFFAGHAAAQGALMEELIQKGEQVSRDITRSAPAPVTSRESQPSAALSDTPASNSGNSGVTADGSAKRAFAKSNFSVVPAPFFLAIAPDGRWLASSDGREIRLMNVETGDVMYSLTIPRKPSDEGGSGDIAVSPDGRFIALGIDGLTMWDVSSGRQMYNQHFHYDKDSRWEFWFPRLVFSNDGRLLYGGTLEGYIFVFDAASGRVIRRVQGIRRGTRFMHFEIAPQLDIAAFFEDESRDIGLVRLSGGAARPAVFSSDGTVSSARFSPDGKLLASGTKDGTLRVWNTGNDTLVWSLAGLGGGVTGLSFTPDGGVLAVGIYRKGLQNNRDVRFYSASDGKLIKVLSHEKFIVPSILRFSADGRWFGVIEGGQPALWDLKQVGLSLSSPASAGESVRRPPPVSSTGSQPLPSQAMPSIDDYRETLTRVYDQLIPHLNDVSELRWNADVLAAYTKLVTPLRVPLQAPEIVQTNSVQCERADSILSKTALPKIICSEGLFRACSPSRDEIGFILAHEIVHIRLGHPPPWKIISSSPVQLASQRAMEYEADRIAPSLMKAAGFDPKAAITFLQKMGRYEKTQGDPYPCSREPQFDHPCIENRIEALSQLPY